MLYNKRQDLKYKEAAAGEPEVFKYQVPGRGKMGQMEGTTGAEEGLPVL